MNSIAELMRQRLDPFPLIDQLKKAGVLTNLDVQFFLEVCTTASLCILQVMREMDRVIHDVPHMCTMRSLSWLMRRTSIMTSFWPDHTLKPLVELERVRASSDKRLSKASSRNSAYSLLEGGPDSECDHLQQQIPVDLDLSFPGHQRECCHCLRDMLRVNTSLQKIRLRSNNLSHGLGATIIAEALAKFSARIYYGLELYRKLWADIASCEALAEIVTHCKNSDIWTSVPTICWMEYSNCCKEDIPLYGTVSKIVTSSKPKLKILLWGNSFDELLMFSASSTTFFTRRPDNYSLRATQGVHNLTAAGSTWGMKHDLRNTFIGQGCHSYDTPLKIEQNKAP
ncbi:hypothetical protein Btru_056182 [Bulinus truncatus]|nr:hypothetical protein Btru_056182 [Bulinus truncatus]